MPYLVTTVRVGMGTSEGLSIRVGGFFSQRLASVSTRAVATLDGVNGDAEHVSWEQLARLAGMPSWGYMAEYALRAHERERARDAILDRYNRERVAA